MKVLKTLFLMLLAVGMTAGLVSGQAEARGTVTLSIPFVDTSGSTALPTLDGVGTDAFWTGVPTTTMNAIIELTQPTNTADLFATFKVAWARSGSVDRLYFFVDVTDELDNTSGPIWFQNDSVEIYVDINNTTNTAYTGDVAAFNAGGPVQVHVNLNATVGVHVGSEIFLTAAQSTFFVANPAGKTMYEGWMAFPTQSLSGKTINFGIDLNDNDSGARDHHLAWLGDSGTPTGPPYTDLSAQSLTPWSNATHLAKATLASAPPPPTPAPVPQATPSASAPTIGTMGIVVLGIALLMMAAGILKKGRKSEA